MTDIERKAAFYLGKEYDLEAGEVVDDAPIMYDARDLTTHAVCVGMTGSGKTGLGVVLLEEAALDGIPSIIIDPKGDMTNLLLNFPDLAPSDFEPWINPDDARRKEQTVGEFAQSTANLWSNGLAKWGEDGARVQRLRDASDFRVFTPGSDAGIPINVLQSFAAPALSWDEDGETIRELIASTVSGLLGLVDIDADPVRSREHILLSRIFENAWRQGEDLDLARLIQEIQSPPMEKLGVFDIDTFYPEKDRFELAMALNSMIASPSFENWLKGEPLDISALTKTENGKTKTNIFYIAHLSEPERVFFVTLLLEQVLSWMRQLSGTTSLRCLVYFDELFGYFPPYPANPPSKRPLLALLKTARAFGVGLVLTTQNPVDLDYKGLTNTGTWFIGKLQTDRDKARLLEGLENVVAEAGTMMDRRYIDRLISSVDSRVFILHNVHEDQPVLFNTRWALSYLRGPLTRQQIRTLMTDKKAERAAQAQVTTASVGGAATRPISHRTSAPAQPARPETPEGYTPVQPRVNARVAQYYLPITQSQQIAAQALVTPFGGGVRVVDAQIAYAPYLLGMVSTTFIGKSGISHKEKLAIAQPLPGLNEFVIWQQAIVQGIELTDLRTSPQQKGLYALLPDGMDNSPPYTQMRNSLVDYVYRDRGLRIWVSEKLGIQSKLNESEKEFRRRCEDEAREQREAALDKAKTKHDREIDRIEDRLKKEERELEEDRIDLRGRRTEEVASIGESLVGMLLGGRRRTTMVSTASRRRRMTQKARLDLEESEEMIAEMQNDLETLRAERDRDLEDIREEWEDAAAEIAESVVRPRKSDIRVDAFGLAWAPQWLLTYQDQSGVTGQQAVPAYSLEPVRSEG